MKLFIRAGACLLSLVQVYFVGIIAQSALASAVPEILAPTGLLSAAGLTPHAAVRDDLIGLQLVRKGGRSVDGEGTLSRLLTRPGEILTSFIPVRNNVVYNNPSPGTSAVVVKDTGPATLGVVEVKSVSPTLAFNPTSYVIADPTSFLTAAVVQQPPVNTILLREVPTTTTTASTAPPQPIYIQVGPATPTATVQSGTPTDNTAVVLQTVDVQSLINQLCKEYGCPSVQPVPTPK